MPDEQELAHEAEVALGRRGERRHRGEDHAGADRGVADQRHAVLHRERDVEDRPQPPAQQAGHQQQQRDADAAVAVGGDAELQADHRGEHHQRADDRARHDDAARRHADPGADHRRHHRQGEQQVGVAQDLLALRSYGDVLDPLVGRAAAKALIVGTYGFQFGLHPSLQSLCND